MTEQTVRDFKFRGHHLPEHMIDSVLRYFNDHIPPGIFLKAVLENNFMAACLLADDHNIMVLPAFAAFLYEAPLMSFGSPEKVKAWIAQGIGGGTDAE